MRPSFELLILAGLAFIYTIRACEPEESQDGCKIEGTTCTCAFGCRNEFIFKTKRHCLKALRESRKNICNQKPCARGSCVNTMQEPHFTCNCQGIGYFGFKCEKVSLPFHDKFPTVIISILNVLTMKLY